MKIALAVPSYHKQVHVCTAVGWMQDALTAVELGWRPFPLWVDCSGIARARNVIVDTAIKADARLLLMCDSDTFPDVQEGGLASMWQVMQKHNAAAVGAAVVTRNSASRVNCEPSQPGESYPGEVGTGYFLLDLFKLRNVPRPWFKHEDTADGLKVSVGEDIYACRLFKQHGHTVIVNYELPMAHADERCLRTFE